MEELIKQMEILLGDKLDNLKREEVIKILNDAYGNGFTDAINVAHEEIAYRGWNIND